MEKFLADLSNADADKPQHGNILQYDYGHARYSPYLPFPYLPPLNSMPVPFGIPLPMPASVSGPKQEVLIPVEYQHHFSKTKAMKGPRKTAHRKTFPPKGVAKSEARTSALPVEVDMQNGGEPVILIDNEEGRRPRPSESKKRLKVLFTKTLKNSDVGCLGRIALPKREAESNLPKLEDKTSMELVVTDLVGSTKCWILRYKLLSSSRSRVYVFEHTGEFVRQHGINAGDSLTLYEDDCMNYYFSVKKAELPTTMEQSKDLFGAEVSVAGNAAVHEGVGVEAIDQYLKGSLDWAVLSPRLELSPWSSISKLWEEASRRELEDCYKGLGMLPECSRDGDGLGSLHDDHSRMTG